MSMWNKNDAKQWKNIWKIELLYISGRKMTMKLSIIWGRYSTHL